MKRTQISILVAVLTVLATFSIVSAQDAYTTDFVTAITYQNVDSTEATVQFEFFDAASGGSTVVTKQLPANAGASLFVGGLSGDEALDANFLGSAVISADAQVIATLVQIPQNDAVRNRPLSNGFSGGSPRVLLSTVLKEQFNTSSKFSIQNASGAPVNVTADFFAVGSTTPVQIARNGIAPGAATYFEVDQLSELPSPFNGSAVVTAVDGAGADASIVGSVLELQTNNVGARAFEGVNGGATTIYMSTALCEFFSGTTFYAVQNVAESGTADITVQYNNLDGSSAGTSTAQVTAGGKASFNACDAGGISPGFSGAAIITSSQPLVVIGKVGGTGSTLYTAFLGEESGSSTLALPYVRQSVDAQFDSGAQQRASIAIQNIGSSAVNNVRVRYLNKNGEEQGVHTIASIAPGAKANSRATDAGLDDFGNPTSNPGGGFGGSAIVEGGAGSQLIAVVRIATQTDAGRVAEDYNGIGLD